MTPLGVAVIGAGYWGPNLIRNLAATPQARVRWVCDLDLDRAHAAVGRYSTIPVTDRLEDVLDDAAVEAVVVATPASTHHAIATAALRSGRHVMIEKPLASDVAQGEEIVELGRAAGLVVMCDHTYCYTPAVQAIRDLVATGTLGELQYVDSVRINLGLVQHDVDVFWDLAPHDLSILDAILPEGCVPTGVSALGADPIGAGQACVGYLTLPLTGGAIAHAHVNWLSPTKIRTTIVAGSRRTVVWDDTNPTQRVSVFDRGVDVVADLADPEARRRQLVSYRLGDMVAPALPETEALAASVREFIAAVQERRQPFTDGAAGLRVLRILEASRRSLLNDGALVGL